MSRFLDFFPTRFLRLSGLLNLLFCLSLFGCTQAEEPKSTTIDQWLEIRLGEKTIEVQIAHRENEMRKGLMHRTSMGENHGMLFYYSPPKQMSFWMQNTKIPLDIGYFTSDGILREIYPMYPMDLTSVKSRRHDLLMALEMNQGWYAKNGIKPGDQLKLELLKKALLSRGVANREIPF
jgi:uncharacterized protein